MDSGKVRELRACKTVRSPLIRCCVFTSWNWNVLDIATVESFYFQEET